MKRHFVISVIFGIVLLQSCKVYQEVPVSISESVEKGRVKLVRKPYSQLELRKVYMKDSVYYGTYGPIGLNEISLDSNQISSVYLLDIEKTKKNRKKSTIILGSTVIGIPVLIVLGTLLGLNRGWIGR